MGHLIVSESMGNAKIEDEYSPITYLDSSRGGSPCSDYGVDEDRQLRCAGVGAVRGCVGCRDVVREVVVVFDGLEGGRLAEEAQVVYWDWVWEESLDCWARLAGSLPGWG